MEAPVDETWFYHAAGEGGWIPLELSYLGVDHFRS